MEKLPKFPPTNDIIMKIAAHSPVMWLLFFVSFNYGGIILIHIIQKRGLEIFYKDLYYHVVWFGLIPLVYILIFPGAYSALRDFFESLKKIISVSDSTYSVKLDIFYGSWLVSVLTAVAAILSVFGWMQAWLLSCELEKINCWWFTEQKLTPPGIFFLMMCTLVAWSAILFFVNAVYGEYSLLRIITHAADKIDSKEAKKLPENLKQFEKLMAWVLGLWAVVTLGFVLLLGYQRHKAGITAENDILLLITAIATLVVLVVLFISPVYNLHKVFVTQKNRFRGMLPSDYPEWPVTLGTILAAVGIIGSGIGVIAYIEMLRRLP